MGKFIVLCVAISALLHVRRTLADDQGIFRKCCNRNESLIIISDYGSNSSERFECVDSASAKEYNITIFSQLIISDNILLDYGIPTDCELQSVPVTEAELTSTSNDTCYDRVIAEIVEGTQKQIIPKILVLTCAQNRTERLQPKVYVDLLRKCCPAGEEYDAKYHVCRAGDEETTTEWLLTQLNFYNNSIYDVEVGLHCKSDEYSVELSSDKFSFDLEGSVLNVFESNEIRKVARGDWCVDRDYNTKNVIARVCTQNCSEYGAFCFRKCCPVGEHYKPFRCGNSRSACVPSVDVLFNTSIYLDPLESMDSHLLDVQGIRTGLKCNAGKFALNRSSPLDAHWLGTTGLLEGTSWDPQNYCIESFDFRFCPDGEVTVTPLVCFLPQEPETKNYTVAVVTNTISAVFLFLTVVVYISLSELRNLHGRTVICHTSTMLFGYSCLARVQVNNVESNVLCTFLGYGIYFGFVGAFVWLNVMCFDIWWTFGNIRSVQPLRKVSAERRRFLWYSLYAWGVTLFLTAVVYLFDMYPVSDLLKANMGQGMCFFGTAQNSASDWPHYIFFVIPMGVLSSINLILWVLTARHCARVKSEVHRMQAGSVGDRAKRTFSIDRAKYVLTGKLWVVMGAGWISELLSTLFYNPAWFWGCIDLINQLQGVFIFLILVFKPKVYHLIKKKLGLEKPEARKNGTSSGRTSSTFLSRTISSDERTTLRVSLPNNDLKKA